MSYLIAPRPVKGIIDHLPPVNMRPEWRHRFRPDNAYRDVRLGARQLSNVFVNHYGLVMANGMLVQGCAPNIGFSGYDENFHYRHWRKAVEQMLVCRFGKSLPSKRLDDGRTYLLIHSPWFSYYFWISECLPRLLMVREHLKDLVLIYPQNWEGKTFVNETLKLFPELRIEVVPKDVHLFVKDLVMPEVKPWTPMFIPDQIHQVRSLLFNELLGHAMDSTVVPTGRVYMSRAVAARRRFTDEPLVEHIMQDHGFEVVQMENLSFTEQIGLMRQTSFLTGITGAGLINIHFLTPGSLFLDLSNRDYLTKDFYKFHYFKLCNILKVDYALAFFDHECSPDVSFYGMQNLIPVESELRRDLEFCLDFKNMGHHG
ncbi:MAG: glycosyltransferase family 61 protein [Flavobacteriales bacterium]|nr:glycosyltransferase family 61 protein [Flavobacteriales bacterium]